MVPGFGVTLGARSSEHQVREMQCAQIFFEFLGAWRRGAKLFPGTALERGLEAIARQAPRRAARLGKESADQSLLAREEARWLSASLGARLGVLPIF